MSELWGVSSYVGPSGARVSYEAGTQEVQRDVASAVQHLGSLGVQAHDRVLVCSLLCEAAQWWPFTIAPMLLGAQVSLADATRSDAARVAMFCRELEFRAILGVDAEIVAGLVDLGHDPRAVLCSVGVVGASPDASLALEGCDADVRLMTTLGPTVALAEAPGSPLQVVADEWSLSQADDRIALTALAHRRTSFERASTAVRGEVVDAERFWPHPTTSALHTIDEASAP